VARRKYRNDALSSAAGPRPDEPAPAEQHPLGSEPAASSPQPPASDQAEPAQHFSTGLKDQIAQQRAYADRPQPQQQHVDPLAAYLLSVPGLTIPKFQFLYHYFAQRPHLLNGDHWQLLQAAHHITTNERKIPEDTNEYFTHMHSLLNQHAPPPQAAPPAVHEPVPPPMTHIDLEKVESPEGEPEEAHMSAMFSAPVSRGSDRYSIEPEPTAGSVRLSKAEVEHAAAAGVSVEEYGKQKLRMLQMKKSKLIRDE
jgi:hypothetical protein